MKFLASFLIIGFAVPVAFLVAEVNFSRTLKIGMRGEDVREMQKVLNADTETRIEGVGAGSPGKETDYFGSATRRALIKFQEKYHEEVLIPTGLSRGTGVFGGKTRAKFAALERKKLEALAAPNGVVSIAVQGPTVVGSIIKSFPLIDKKDFNVTVNGVATLGAYYSAYGQSAMGVNFSQEELASMVKKKEISNEKGDTTDRIMLLEELIELSKNGDTSKELLFSFMAWASLDKKMSDELKKMPITSAVLSANQQLTSWYKYHETVAERFGSGALSAQEKESLALEFKSYGSIHKRLYGKSIAKAEKKEPTFFSLVKTAEAALCGATHFGGRVGPWFTCNFGIVGSVIGTCGGVLLYTWVVQAANPYLYHNIYVYTTPILGKSAMLPGICPLGFPPFVVPFPYTDIAIYYGTAAY